MAFGPTEELDPSLWIGYDIEGEDRDLHEIGLLPVEHLSSDEIRERFGVTSFVTVGRDDEALRRTIGLD